MPPPVPVRPASRPIVAPLTMPAIHGTPACSRRRREAGGCEPPGADNQDRSDERSVELTRQVDAAADEGRRDRADRERDEAAPGQVTGHREPDGDDRGDEQVEYQRRGPHDRGWHADERHCREVCRRPGMPDARVQECGREEERGEEEGVRCHPATAAGSSRLRRMPRYAFQGADLGVVGAGHPGEHLADVVEVVNRPRREQLTERHLAERRVQAAPVEVSSDAAPRAWRGSRRGAGRTARRVVESHRCRGRRARSGRTGRRASTCRARGCWVRSIQSVSSPVMRWPTTSFGRQPSVGTSVVSVSSRERPSAGRAAGPACAAGDPSSRR